MELNALWRAARRRWYLTAGGALVAIGLTALMVIQIGPTYKAESSVLLFPPTSSFQKKITGTTQESTQGNPYLLLGGLSQARDIVLRAMQSKPATDAFARRQPNAQYEVTPDYTTSGPIIVIDVTSKSPTDAVRGLQDAVNTIPDVLASMQSGLSLPDNGLITSRVLTTDTTPEVVHSDQIRSGILVGAVVSVVVLLLLALIDGLLQARRSGAKPPRSEEVEGDDPPDATRPGPPTTEEPDGAEREITPVGN